MCVYVLFAEAEQLAASDAHAGRPRLEVWP